MEPASCGWGELACSWAASLFIFYSAAFSLVKLNFLPWFWAVSGTGWGKIIPAPGIKSLFLLEFGAPGI
jgi:hypothetical protein